MKRKMLIFLLKHDIIRNIFLILTSIPVSIFYGLMRFCCGFVDIWTGTLDSIKENEEGLKRLYKVK